MSAEDGESVEARWRYQTLYELSCVLQRVEVIFIISYDDDFKIL